MSAVPKGSTILVTGANGFISSHVCDQLLAYGYKVRGTVRSEDKAKWMTELFERSYPKGAFEPVIVKDLLAPDAFDEVVKGVAGVAHVASPVSFDPNGNQAEVAVKGTKNLLAAAAKHKAITRFVLTSSSTAATLPKPGVKFHIDANSWNHEAVELAKQGPFEGHAKGFQKYAASKMLGEQEAWAYVKDNKPGYILNTVLPNFTLGQILHNEQFGSTAGMVRGLYDGDVAAIDSVNNLGPQYAVHVKDIAALHVAGIALEDVQNERLFGFAMPFNYNLIVDTIHKLQPDHKLPPRQENCGEDLSTVDTASTVAALKKLRGNGFLSFEEAIRDVLSPKAYP